MKLFVLVALAAVLVGCNLPPQRREPEDVRVDWANYRPQVREAIGQALFIGDCDTLLREIEVAKENDEAQRERVGNGHDDSVMYIQALAWKAGCYEYDP